MPESFPLPILVVMVAIGFGIATVIGTRTLSPRAATIMAAICECAGATTEAVFGVAFARIIGKGLIKADTLVGHCPPILETCLSRSSR